MISFHDVVACGMAKNEATIEVCEQIVFVCSPDILISSERIEWPLAIGSNACQLKWILFVSSLLYSLGILGLHSSDDEQKRKGA